MYWSTRAMCRTAIGMIARSGGAAATPARVLSREFVRGYANLHLAKWRKAERALADAAPQPMAHYFRGLCQVALGHRVEARRAFTREIHRDDIGIAERILIAGRVLGLFPGDPNRAPLG